MIGTVTKVHWDRGYFFIKPDDGSRDVFGHVKELAGGLVFDGTLTEARVEFGVKETDRGPRAVSIHPSAE